MKVLLADDQTLFRDSLKTLLEANGMDVVGEADNGRQAVSLAESLRPDLVLMDLAMPLLDGMEATQQIRQLCPEVKVVILTGSESETELMNAIRLGVDGYLIKNMNARRVIRVLERVARGEPGLGPEAMRRLMSEVVQDRKGHDPDALTKRELEILGLMAWGTTSNRKLAQSLNVSENTIKFHVRNILDKLRLHSRAQAVGHALRHRLVSPEEAVAV